MFQKNIENGFIVSIASGAANGNISEEEYNDILTIIRNKPTAESGYDYRLTEALDWELCEFAGAEEIPQGYAAEQLEAMTSSELEQICSELGISPNKSKTNMVVLILSKQNEFFL